jgi:hypothetical protein
VPLSPLASGLTLSSRMWARGSASAPTGSWPCCLQSALPVAPPAAAAVAGAAQLAAAQARPCGAQLPALLRMTSLCRPPPSM